MNLLLVGASGFIGRRVYRFAKRNGIHVVGTATHPQNDEWVRFNLATDSIGEALDASGLSEKLQQGEQVFAFVTAFYTGNEGTAAHLHDAEQVNLFGTQKLLCDLSRLGIRTLWLSTEQVFCGRDGLAPYHETDMTSPVLAYGRHKAEMECFIKETLPDTIIFRLSQNIDNDPQGIQIFNDVLRRVQNGERQFQSIAGQIISPTYVGDTARWGIEALKRGIPGGIYHFANSESMPRSELVERFLQAVCPEAGVKEVPLAHFGFKEGRPMDTRMCIDKIKHAMPDLVFQSVDTTIHQFVENLSKV